MRIYETMLVLDPEMSKEQTDSFLKKLKQFLGDRGAEVLKVEEWGVHTLAYEIKNKNQGYYLLLYLNGDATLIAEMEKSLRLMEEVLRYLTIKREEGDIEASQQVEEPKKKEEPEEERAEDERAEGAAEEQ